MNKYHLYKVTDEFGIIYQALNQNDYMKYMDGEDALDEFCDWEFGNEAYDSYFNWDGEVVELVGTNLTWGELLKLREEDLKNN